MGDARSEETGLDSGRDANWTHSYRARVIAATVVFCFFLAVIVTGMSTGYRSQMDIRLNERTRELGVAYNSVTSMAAAAPELLSAQIADDPRVTRILMEANTADETKFDQLRGELLEYLQDDYETLKQLDFRQLHFHLRDNRSFIRFHRPERYGDDLTTARATVRDANATQTPRYGFEEGRVINGFRYVFPVFHEGEHAGSFEASINYQAIISRMHGSRPMVLDFVLNRSVIEDKVFESELDYYTPSCFSDEFARETSLSYPDTTAVLGFEVSCFLAEAQNSRELTESLEEYRETTVSFVVREVPVTVSLLPIRNYEGEAVAFILGYAPFEEKSTLRTFFFVLGVTLSLLSSVVYALFLRITYEHARALRTSTQLEHVTRSKDRFFSIVSHDLRGPTGALASLAGMLSEELRDHECVPESTREVAATIAESAHNSHQLLMDLLDWARSQRGDIVYHRAEQPLHDLVDDQFSILRNAAAEKKITLENNVGETTVFADTYMLKTIIRNLVSNAIKFTPEGGSVTVEAEEQLGAEAQADAIRVSVADTGVGMTAKQQNDIFDLSVKSSTKGTHAESGTGLGLTVCREFADKHGGTISVESELGVGSTFHVFFPKNGIKALEA